MSGAAATAERIFYRIVRSEAMSLEDFMTAKQLGKPLRDPAMERQWAEGISAYDSLEYAREQARLYRFKLGRYVVAVRVPRSPGIDIEQSGKDPHHFTLYGSAELLRSVAEGVPVRVEEEGR